MKIQLAINNEQPLVKEFIALTALNKIRVPALIECLSMLTASTIEQTQDKVEYQELIGILYDIYIDLQEVSIKYNHLEKKKLKLVVKGDKK